MSESRPPIRVVEFASGVAGAVCGRLFAGLGHDVISVELDSHPSAAPGALRATPPLGRSGDGLLFNELCADKERVAVTWRNAPRLLAELLEHADILILEQDGETASQLGLDPQALRERWPALVIASVTGLSTDVDAPNLPADSLLAEAYGGLANMIGSPDRQPLSLGGDQAAYCTGVTAFLGAMLALKRRAEGHGGEIIDAAMSDVAAYMDWKSDVSYYMTGRAPRRSGTAAGGWRLLPARDGWVGFIFQQRHWAQVVELVDAPELRDPALADETVRAERADEWWPVVERWTLERGAEEIYEAAQQLGLPFGWVQRASDLERSEQLKSRGFISEPSAVQDGAPAVGSPVQATGLDWRSSRARVSTDPLRTLGWDADGDTAGAQPADSASVTATDAGALAGVVVLDFGTITAGAAVTRLLADYGATVLKVEWPDRPDTFRSWMMPESAHHSDLPPDAWIPSPYFASNNVGKLGVAINLKTDEGRELAQRLARKAHVLVENYRVGVTKRLGIDAATVAEINPDLVYLSLSSQGQEGPEALNSSFGSTLDLLSGLASVTGYDADSPLWSSSDVNYPDQLVSLFGAAFIVYTLAQKLAGVHLDASQREVVSWTLGSVIADFVTNGVDSAPSGNRRPGRAPHDAYPCAAPDTWVAVSCFSDAQRQALAGIALSAELADWPAERWAAEQQRVDEELSAWTRQHSREQAAALLRAAGVPAAPVNDAAARSQDAGLQARGVLMRQGDVPVKGLPMRMRGYDVQPKLEAPRLGQDTRQVLRDMCDMSDDEIDELERKGAIYCGSRRDLALELG